ncbi:MAG: hypothetical protein COA73_13755 [Candidatus Hydrogenedentota bacterium]|nr:MAG: hypothetical protein COA73_13755 [Candidatus Hydrogenedentota bacterium]
MNLYVINIHRVMALVLVVAVTGCASIPMDTKVVIRPEILAIQDYALGVDSRESITVVEEIVRDALTSKNQSRRVAAELTKLLHLPGTTLDAKQVACRQLWLVGGPENVSSIAKLLGHVETADMARYALEGMDTPLVDDQLIYYLDKGPDSAKPGMINSLAARGTVSAVPTLQTLSTNGNDAIADAARAALEKLDT